MTFEEFTPVNLTRRQCTGFVSRIYDPEGLLAPITLKLKNDLRMLIKFESSWDKPIPGHQRQIWLTNFEIIEDLRDVLYVRCVIPVDAKCYKARVL